LKANFESGPSYISFKRLVPSGFNAGLTGSTCTALPRLRVRKVPELSDSVARLKRRKLNLKAKFEGDS